jgi:hypothetical protein
MRRPFKAPALAEDRLVLPGLQRLKCSLSDNPGHVLRRCWREMCLARDAPAHDIASHYALALGRKAVLLDRKSNRPAQDAVRNWLGQPARRSHPPRTALTPASWLRKPCADRPRTMPAAVPKRADCVFFSRGCKELAGPPTCSQMLLAVRTSSTRQHKPAPGSKQ